MSEKHSIALRKGWTKRKIPDFDRFLSKINKNNSNGCWNWIGTKFDNGYGSFNYRENDRQKIVKANRQAWRYFRNEEPGKMFVLHKCDNKACVNPDHLYLGDHAQNMKDARERGRHASGPRNKNFIRTEGLLDRINDLRLYKVPPFMIAEWLSISRNTVLRALGKMD